MVFHPSDEATSTPVAFFHNALHGPGDLRVVREVPTRHVGATTRENVDLAEPGAMEKGEGKALLSPPRNAAPEPATAREDSDLGPRSKRSKHPKYLK
jgi:hypothetical protein